jgi:hypothetical protein
VKNPAGMASDSFAIYYTDIICEKKCCQMSGIPLFSTPIAPHGAGASSFAL